MVVVITTNKHKMVTIFTSLFIKITEYFKLLLIIYHYHLQYLNIGFFFLY